jgi:glycosyltransferase involved in cell wall biosynthesis
VSRQVGIPQVVTAHFLSGNRTRAIYIPYRKAVCVICVSRAVEVEMGSCFSGNTTVVRNGLAPPSIRWQGSLKNRDTINLLFIGRLTHSKGVQDVILALAGLETKKEWKLDILGDGPMRSELTELARINGVADRIVFHGFRDDTDQWLVNCACLLFPSHHEGMPLTLARAVQLGTPIIASDIIAVRELCSAPVNLIPPGDLTRWRDALDIFLTNGTKSGNFDPTTVPTLEQMALQTEKIYQRALSSTATFR